MKKQNETTEKIKRISDIIKMGEDSLSGLNRADAREAKALDYWNAGLVTSEEALNIVRG